MLEKSAKPESLCQDTLVFPIPLMRYMSVGKTQYGNHQQSYPTQAPTANNGNDYRPSPGPVVPPSHGHGQGQGQPYGSKYYHDEYSHLHPNLQPHPANANANYSGGKEDLALGPGSGFHSSSPPFDRIHMPFMELNSASHSETKHFEDLMSSPGLNLMFSRGIGSEPRDRRTTRYVLILEMYWILNILKLSQHCIVLGKCRIQYMDSLYL